jgi:hypothetical protein
VCPGTVRTVYSCACVIMAESKPCSYSLTLRHMYCTSLETLRPQDSVDVRYEQYRRKLLSKKFARRKHSYSLYAVISQLTRFSQTSQNPGYRLHKRTAVLSRDFANSELATVHEATRVLLGRVRSQLSVRTVLAATERVWGRACSARNTPLTILVQKKHQTQSELGAPPLGLDTRPAMPR